MKVCGKWLLGGGSEDWRKIVDMQRISKSWKGKAVEVNFLWNPGRVFCGSVVQVTRREKATNLDIAKVYDFMPTIVSYQSSMDMNTIKELE